jgi:hypothetical protein
VIFTQAHDKDLELEQQSTQLKTQAQERLYGNFLIDFNSYMIFYNYFLYKFLFILLLLLNL